MRKRPWGWSDLRFWLARGPGVSRGGVRWLVSTGVSVLASVLLSALVRLPAEEVDVTLHSGETIRGVVVGDDSEQIRLLRSIPTSSMPIDVVITYPRSAIAQVQAIAQPNPEYDQRVATVGATAQGHIALAKWCRDEDLPEQARLQAMQAHALAPSDPQVTTLLIDLGYTYADGRWQDANAYLLETGRVRYAGRIMSQAEADALRSRADNDQRVAELIQQVGASAARLDALRQSFAGVSRALLEVPDMLSANQDRISQARLLERRFDQLLDATEPGVIASPGSVPGVKQQEHLDEATLRAQAEAAYQALPQLLKNQADLNRKLQTLAAGKRNLLEQMRDAEQALASANATIDELKTDTEQLAAPAER